jgi:hypothetical protein
MKGHKGWYYEGWRHSLAAKGIKTSMALRDWMKAYKGGVREAEIRARAGLAQFKAKPIAIPSSKYALLTEEERKRLALEKFKASLRQRERRQVEAVEFVDNFVGPKREGEDIEEYLRRVKKDIGPDYWNAWGAEWQKTYRDEAGEVKSKMVQLTIGDYLRNAIKRRYDVRDEETKMWEEQDIEKALEKKAGEISPEKPSEPETSEEQTGVVLRSPIGGPVGYPQWRYPHSKVIGKDRYYYAVKKEKSGVE